MVHKINNNTIIIINTSTGHMDLEMFKFTKKHFMNEKGSFHAGHCQV